jgi:hypothetical protein
MRFFVQQFDNKVLFYAFSQRTRRDGYYIFLESLSKNGSGKYEKGCLIELKGYNAVKWSVLKISSKIQQF